MNPSQRQQHTELNEENFTAGLLTSQDHLCLGITRLPDESFTIFVIHGLTSESLECESRTHLSEALQVAKEFQALYETHEFESFGCPQGAQGCQGSKKGGCSSCAKSSTQNPSKNIELEESGACQHPLEKCATPAPDFK